MNAIIKLSTLDVTNAIRDYIRADNFPGHNVYIKAIYFGNDGSASVEVEANKYYSSNKPDFGVSDR